MTAAIEEEKPAEVASTPSPATNTEIVQAQSHAPALYTESVDAEGEFDSSDEDKPMMQITAKTGELSNTFSPGDILLNKEVVICGITPQGKPPLTINLFAVAIKKRRQNDLDIDGGEMGDAVDTAAEVIERGGVLGYRPYADKAATQYWKPILHVVFLIEMPEGLSPDGQALFPYKIEGKNYSLVGYTARAKTAYNGIAKPLIQAKRAKGTVRTTAWTLSTKGEAFENKSWIQPLLRQAGPTPEGILKFITENA